MNFDPEILGFGRRFHLIHYAIFVGQNVNINETIHPPRSRKGGRFARSSKPFSDQIEHPESRPVRTR